MTYLSILGQINLKAGQRALACTRVSCPSFYRFIYLRVRYFNQNVTTIGVYHRQVFYWCSGCRSDLSVRLAGWLSVVNLYNFSRSVTHLESYSRLRVHFQPFPALLAFLSEFRFLTHQTWLWLFEVLWLCSWKARFIFSSEKSKWANALAARVWVLHIAKVAYFFSFFLPTVEWPILGPLPFFFYQKSFIFRFLENCFWEPNLYIAVG